MPRLLCVALLISFGLFAVLQADEDKPKSDEAAAEQPATEEAPADEAAADEENPAAEEPAAEEPASPEAEVKLILSNLDNPTGVAVEPETGRVYVSDSGAGRVVSFNPKGTDKVAVEIDGFSIDVYGKGPMYNIGPLGLVFLNKDALAVGGGDLKDGEELLRVFDLSSEEPQSPDSAKYKLGPIPPGADSEKGEGNFYGLAASKTAIYVTSNGDDTKGWVLRTELTDGVPGELKPFIATKVALEDTDAPVGITLNNDGQIVIGQMGEINKPKDSLYTVYDPESGELLARSETGLYDITGLAYSPSGKLYATDFAWMAPEEGGLFRLDVTDTTVEAVKIASLDKPTALAFTPDGRLYVSLIGTAAEGEKKKPGKLVQILGEL
jgi:sugar lactone lactonase YvrE